MVGVITFFVVYIGLTLFCKTRIGRKVQAIFEIIMVIIIGAICFISFSISSNIGIPVTIVAALLICWEHRSWARGH